jgi:hypothetical protein
LKAINIYAQIENSQEAIYEFIHNPANHSPDSLNQRHENSCLTWKYFFPDTAMLQRIASQTLAPAFLPERNRIAVGLDITCSNTPLSSSAVHVRCIEMESSNLYVQAR